VALVTVQQLAAWLQRPFAPGEEAAAQMLLDAVSDEVQTYCGWHIAPVITETVTVDGSGGVVQPLPTLRLLDIISVTESGTAVDVDGVQWSEAGWMVRPGCRWTCDLRGIVAEIEHGYTETPPAIVALICGVVARALANPSGVARESSGGESITYAVAADGTASLLTGAEMRILDRRYRIPLRA
jgi:hypothetical protein